MLFGRSHQTTMMRAGSHQTTMMRAAQEQVEKVKQRVSERMALLASAPARRNEQQQRVDAELVFDNSIRPSDESSYKFNSREDVLPVQNVVEPKIEKNVKRNDHQDPRTMLTPDVESKVVPKAIFTSKRSKIWINFHCCDCSEFF